MRRSLTGPSCAGPPGRWPPGPASASSADFEPENVRRGIAAYAAGGVTLVARSHSEVGAFFEGLELLPPGIVSVARWRPEETPDDAAPVSLYGVVGLKR